MGVFDIQKRAVAAVQNTPAALTWPCMAFSPSGRKIGCIAFDRVLVWDAASGRLENDFVPVGANINGAIAFPDDGFILGGNAFLLALETQLKLWHYQGAECVRTVGGMTLLGVSGSGGPGVIGPGKMPHPEAKDVLVASVEGPKQREVRYMFSGTYKVQEYTTRLKFAYDGKDLWHTSGTNVPGFISLKKGENIEGVLRKAGKQPEYEFYDRVTLPEFLQKPSDAAGPGGGQTLGVSKVTPTGLQ